MSTMTEPQATRDDALAASMAEVSREIAAVERDLRKLYVKRVKLWQRAVRKGWTQARIAAASNATEANVTQQLRRARLGRR